MNVLSLFAGIGGLDLGLERAGMRIVGQVEIDPWCRAVLRRHWTRVPHHDDVRTCVRWWRSEERPVVRLICAGFPCQPVSVAGQKAGKDDPRWLWPATAAVVRALRPPWVVLENVPGLLRDGMGCVLGDLARIGYDAEWDSLPASAFGAPHQRDRVFIVAHADRQRSPWSRGSVRGGELRTHVPRGKQAVAHTEIDRRGARRPQGSAGDGAHRQGFASEKLADATSGGRGTRSAGHAARDSQRGDVAGGGKELADANGQPTIGFAVARPQRHHWSTEPDVGRVAHGVPERVDRLRALGNAVVPQVAEHVGRAVMAAERGNR